MRVRCRRVSQTWKCCRTSRYDSIVDMHRPSDLRKTTSSVTLSGAVGVAGKKNAQVKGM